MTNTSHLSNRMIVDCPTRLLQLDSISTSVCRKCITFLIINMLKEKYFWRDPIFAFLSYSIQKAIDAKAKILPGFATMGTYVLAYFL